MTDAEAEALRADAQRAATFAKVALFCAAAALALAILGLFMPLR